MSEENSRAEALIRAWEKTVDVQQHFNDLSLRVRNFGVTVATAILGGAVFSMRDAEGVTPYFFAAGFVAWLAFYMMDAFWYHRLLLGAVAHGESIEEELSRRGVSGFGLAGAIRKSSAVRLWKWDLRSTGRLHGFYVLGLALFAMCAVVSWTHQGEREDATRSEATVEQSTNG